MKTKEEVIKEAWDFAYNPHIYDDGWFDMNCLEYVPNMSSFLDKIEHEFKGKFVRPKSLQGIENNEGWIKLNGIVNEIDFDGDIFIYTKYGNIELLTQKDFLPINYATHYQKIIKPKPPLHD